MDTSTLNAKAYRVIEIFTEKAVHYQIPIYQRNYAWGQDQIGQLIDDIWNSANTSNSQDYFMGNLIVAPLNKPDGTEYTTYEVVDGQQRLTTLYMLLTHLREKVTHEYADFDGKLTYESRRTAGEALRSLAIHNNAPDTGIQTGYKIICEKISRFPSLNDVKTFAAYLANHVLIVRAILPANTDLNRYFEIMNTRGQQLQQVDIVKARLISYLRGSEEYIELVRQIFARIWDACADMDRYIQMALAPKDTALRGKIFGTNWDQLKIGKFDELCRVLQPEKNNLGISYEPKDVEQAIEFYAGLAATFEEAEEDDSSRFETPIRFTSLLLHTLKLLRDKADIESEDEGQLDDSRLIELFDKEFAVLSEADRSVKSKQFIEKLLCSKFMLDNYLIKREYTAAHAEDGAWSLKRLVGNAEKPTYPPAFGNLDTESDDWLDVATQDILLLQSMLRVTYTAPRTMHWITAILRLDLTGKDRSEAAREIKATLQDFARKRVHRAFFLGQQPSGFLIERIVFTYLDYLLAQKSGSNFSFAYRNSIEHFFPQAPDREQKNWNRVENDDEALHDFGNLALVSVGANSKFSNNLPENKVKFDKIEVQSCKLQKMYEMVRQLESRGQHWDRAAIMAHGAEMVELLASDLTSAGYPAKPRDTAD